VKDAGQKDLLYRHFRAQGWFVLVEVPVATRGSAGAVERLVTDIDVLALRPTPELTWEIVVGDCKTKRSESPANRALWVRALMEYVTASRGYMLLKRDSGRIEPDHKLMADQLGVTLLEEQEFAPFDRALLYPASSERSVLETATQLRGFYDDVGTRFQRLSELVKYLSSGAWGERDHFVMVRQVIGITDNVRSELDPSKSLHVALVLEAAAVFSVALATCVGRMFHQFVAPSDRAALEDALRTMIWGGRERYKSVVALRNQLIHGASDAAAEVDALGLPQWGSFVQLVRAAMEAPRLLFRVPLVLRTLAMQEAGISRRGVSSAHPMVLKLAMSTATYLSEAARLPHDMTARLSAMLVERIAETVETRRAPTTSDPPQSATHQGKDIALTEFGESPSEGQLPLPVGKA
jgi:hypothetical protein